MMVLMALIAITSAIPAHAQYCAGDIGANTIVFPNNCTCEQYYPEGYGLTAVNSYTFTCCGHTLTSAQYGNSACYISSLKTNADELAALAGLSAQGEQVLVADCRGSFSLLSPVGVASPSSSVAAEAKFEKLLKSIAAE
jgi:hypothetical protein